MSYSYRFDAAVASGDRRWVVLYERRGTKGLLLKDGKLVREIDRSFYHADVYHFPILCSTAAMAERCWCTVRTPIIVSTSKTPIRESD